MKSLAIVVSIVFASMTVAQEQSLKSFDVKKYTKIENGDYIVLNPVYQYLNDNYKAVSDKKNLISDTAQDCGFSQSFEQGITYTKRNCGDAFLEHGEVLTIINPNRQSIIEWVESVNKIFAEQDNNSWNFDQTEYQPVTQVRGGYFRILSGSHPTEVKVLVMSGC